jgi:hypothetical protein
VEKTGKVPTDRSTRRVERSVLTEAVDVPIGVAVEGANRNDFKMARATLESIPVGRPEPTPASPQGLCLAEGYDFEEVRLPSEEFGYTAHIRARDEEAQEIKKAAVFRVKARRPI